MISRIGKKSFIRIFRTMGNYALVIAIIEYESIIWSPHKKCDINSIEAIQRSFISKLDGLKDKNHHERLKCLKLYSLERRRDRYDILYAYKILKRTVPNVCLQFKWSSRRGRSLVPPPVTKNSSDHAKTVRNSSYRSRVTRLFNSLPTVLRNITDTNMDKNPKIKSILCWTAIFAHSGTNHSFVGTQQQQCQTRWFTRGGQRTVRSG